MGTKIDRIQALAVSAVALVALALAVSWQASPEDEHPAPPASALAQAQAGEPLLPLVPPSSLDTRKVVLGKKLFHDARLSHDDTVSCASCHDLKRGGVDGLPVSVGIYGRKGSVNAPTVFNSGLNFRQFWDGRAANLEEQAAGPVHNPAEMGSDWNEVIGKLIRVPEYAEEFKALYGSIRSEGIEEAIAAFERSLLTPSRFDRFLQGDGNAISPPEKEGYALFKRYGCVACHQGVNVGGNMFQRFGVMGDYFADRGKGRSEDLGRFNVTHLPEDRHVFKVPSLRNVARTAPYFHDGSVPSLEEAIHVMGRYQLGIELPADDVRLLKAFLESLNGDVR